MNDKRLPERFWNKVISEPNSGCWLWLGCLNKDGYGRFRLGGRMRIVHRVSYEATKGPVPAEMTVDHLCRQRCCVNPDHLESVTLRENILRSPLTQAGRRSRQVACKHGHLFDDANTIVTARGNRACRTCHNASGRRRYRRLRQKVKLEQDMNED